MNIREVSRFGNVWALAGVLALGGAAVAFGVDAERVDKVSKYGFAQTVSRVEKELEREHLMIVAKIDHRNMLSMIGTNIKGATTLEFGKPEMGKMLLPMNPGIGLEMPGKIYVFETADGKVLVSYRRVAKNYGAYGDPEVAKAGEMMDALAEKIATNATS